jgi:hypothetical protein
MASGPQVLESRYSQTVSLLAERESIMGVQLRVDTLTTDWMAERVPLPEPLAQELALRLEVDPPEVASPQCAQGNSHPADQEGL